MFIFLESISNYVLSLLYFLFDTVFIENLEITLICISVTMSSVNCSVLPLADFGYACLGPLVYLLCSWNLHQDPIYVFYLSESGIMYVYFS
jgi:hypothetical protein